MKTLTPNKHVNPSSTAKELLATNDKGMGNGSQLCEDFTIVDNLLTIEHVGSAQLTQGMLEAQLLYRLAKDMKGFSQAQKEMTLSCMIAGFITPNHENLGSVKDGDKKVKSPTAVAGKVQSANTYLHTAVLDSLQGLDEKTLLKVAKLTLTEEKLVSYHEIKDNEKKAAALLDCLKNAGFESIERTKMGFSAVCLSEKSGAAQKALTANNFLIDGVPTVTKAKDSLEFDSLVFTFYKSDETIKELI